MRRLLGPLRTAALLTWTWHHRGSVVRAADLAIRIPERVRRGAMRDAVVEAKAVARLDHRFAPDLSVRFTSVTDGAVVLRDGLDPEDLVAVRAVLAYVPGVLDVETDAVRLPPFDDALSAAS